ncbi:STAS domain-containing protein [Streptomyces sp. NPDC003327]
MTHSRSQGEPAWEGGVPHVFLSEGRRAYRAPTGSALVRRERTALAATWLLCASGEFDSETVVCLHEALSDARHARAERVLLDVSQVTFGDSSFLDELVRAHYAPGRLVLVGPLTRQVRRLLDMTGTRDVFHVAIDRGSADLA